MKSILENEQQKQASPEKYFLHGAHTVITGCRERLYTVINDCALVHRWYTFNARRSPGVCRTMLCSAILHKEGTHLSMEQHISQVMPDITRHAHIHSIAHQSPSSTEVVSEGWSLHASPEMLTMKLVRQTASNKQAMQCKWTRRGPMTHTRFPKCSFRFQHFTA